MLSLETISLEKKEGPFEVEGNLDSMCRDDVLVLIQKEGGNELVPSQVRNEDMFLFVDTDAFDECLLEEQSELRLGEVLEKALVEMLEEVDIPDAAELFQPL